MGDGVESESDGEKEPNLAGVAGGAGGGEETTEGGEQDHAEVENVGSEESGESGTDKFEVVDQEQREEKSGCDNEARHPPCGEQRTSQRCAIRESVQQVRSLRGGWIAAWVLAFRWGKTDRSNPGGGNPSQGPKPMRRECGKVAAMWSAGERNMRRAWVGAASGLFLLSLMAGAWVRGQSAGGAGYHAAGVAQAGSIPYPMNSQAPGFVTLDVSVDPSGAVQNVMVVRDVPPLTAAAQGAVKNWQFTPATADGQAAPGVVPVDVAFNPYNPSGVGLPGESLQPPNTTVSGDFQPAGLVKASYAAYPPNTVASGTVVMMLRVESDGSVHRQRVLRGKGVLVDAATAAVKTWGFTPATYKGAAVGADVAVAFVFAPPQAGTR